MVYNNFLAEKLEEKYLSRFIIAICLPRVSGIQNWNRPHTIIYFWYRSTAEEQCQQSQLSLIKS